jgi:hypothetical protein
LAGLNYRLHSRIQLAWIVGLQSQRKKQQVKNDGKRHFDGFNGSLSTLPVGDNAIRKQWIELSILMSNKV